MSRNVFFRVMQLCSAVAGLFLLLGCHSRPIPVQSRSALGTVCSIRLFDDGKQALYDELFLRLDQIEQEMSSTIETSEISKINAENLSEKNFSDEAKNEFPLSEDVFCVLKTALEVAELTDGAFNPACGSLVKLWDINNRVNETEQRPLPTQIEIEWAKQNTDWKSITLDEEKKTVSVEKCGIQLELGGIAKGYAADELVKILQERKVKRAIIDLGGNIYAFGAKSESADENGADNRTPWRIGIKNPFEMDELSYAVVSCIDKTVVTSGPYERFFEKDGKIYHHILDCKSGYPAKTDLASVSIICKNSMLADSLSTACFVLGSERAKALLEKMNRTEEEAEGLEGKKNGSQIAYIFIQDNGSCLSNCGEELKILKQ